MITLAFYKGRSPSRASRVLDGCIRFATRGRFSHVELISGHVNYGWCANCYSASGRDGGVRIKRIQLSQDSWELVYIDQDHVQPVQFITDRLGAKYDYAGIVFSHFLAFGRHNPDKWFCSEICAAALGVRMPERISPQLLYNIVQWGRDRPQK